MLSRSLLRIHSILRRAAARRPGLFYAATWTALLTATVAVGAFAPEIAFLSIISPSSFPSRSCCVNGFVKVPLDAVPVCLPAHLMVRSGTDFFVPTVFVALVVVGSACAVQTLALWDGFRAS